METLLSKNKFNSSLLEGFENFRDRSLAAAEARRQAANLYFGDISEGAVDRSPRPAMAPYKDGTYRDAFAQYGMGDNVPRSLIKTESSGNWGAQNQEVGAGGARGHYGLLQFGEARLADGKKAGVIPASMTPSQFMADPNAQIAMANWHFTDLDNRIKASGYDRYIGQTIAGTPITMNGMRAMAHLGGFGGLSRFIESRGKYDPSDSFGTSLSAYGRTHSGIY